MAWKEQCKIVFRTTADCMLARNKNRKGITKILRQLSKESDIPFNTLRNWYYEQPEPEEEGCTENGTNVTPEYNIENNNIENKVGKKCRRCGKNPVEIHAITKKPVGVKSRYYGLCQMCKKKQYFIEKTDAGAEEDPQFMTVCPNCQNVYYIEKERLKLKKGGYYGCV